MSISTSLNLNGTPVLHVRVPHTLRETHYYYQKPADSWVLFKQQVVVIRKKTNRVKQ